MKEIILYSSASGIAFLFFLSFLLLGIFKKKKKLVYTSILALSLCIISGGFAASKFVLKSYNHVAELVKPRTGEEIYEALFGEPKTTCVKINHYQDQVVPKIDYAIWLHFQTCPNEIHRILLEYDYSKEIIETSSWNGKTPYDDAISWWNPKVMGDSILVFEFPIIEGKNIRTLWVSMDSTEVYCRDILD